MADNTSTSRLLTVDAKPQQYTFDLTKAAVVVIDMQNDFGSKGGMFERAGLDISGIQKAVAPTAKVLMAARDAGIKVIYVKMQHRSDLSDCGTPDSPHYIKHSFFQVGKKVTAPDGSESAILVEDTWNTAIVDELRPAAGDIIVPKHRYSAFYGTDLDVILKSLGVKTLIMTGCTTSVCVESTIRDGMFLDYSCLLLSDCTAEPVGAEFARTNHDASLLVIERLFGWVSDSGTLLAALAKR